MGRFCALLLACAGTLPLPSETEPLPSVRLGDREPGPGCRRVDAVEVESSGSQCTTREQLLRYAALRGANYVVLDGFTVLDPLDPPVIARARLFSCR
jgi:hypothetical protein